VTRSASATSKLRRNSSGVVAPAASISAAPVPAPPAPAACRCAPATAAAWPAVGRGQGLGQQQGQEQLAQRGQRPSGRRVTSARHLIGQPGAPQIACGKPETAGAISPTASGEGPSSGDTATTAGSAPPLVTGGSSGAGAAPATPGHRRRASRPPPAGPITDCDSQSIADSGSSPTAASGGRGQQAPEAGRPRRQGRLSPHPAPRASSLRPARVRSPR
jgi:hypothetical protein